MFMRSVKIKIKDSASTLKCEISIKFRIFMNLPELEIFCRSRTFFSRSRKKNPEFVQKQLKQLND
jgi:hypothetical protein